MVQIKHKSVYGVETPHPRKLLGRCDGTHISTILVTGSCMSASHIHTNHKWCDVFIHVCIAFACISHVTRHFHVYLYHVGKSRHTHMCMNTITCDARIFERHGTWQRIGVVTLVYIWMVSSYICGCDAIILLIYVCVWRVTHIWVALISRLLKNIGLFCRMTSLL